MLRYRNLVCGCVPHAWGAFAPAKGSLNNMKAIIPAAGLGTRFLPGTKCTPKEMLPVLDKPVIQYVVEEALDPEEVDDERLCRCRRPRWRYAGRLPLSV